MTSKKAEVDIYGRFPDPSVTNSDRDVYVDKDSCTVKIKIAGVIHDIDFGTLRKLVNEGYEVLDKG